MFLHLVGVSRENERPSRNPFHQRGESPRTDQSMNSSHIDQLTDPSGRKSGIGRVREMRSLR